jgi:hypothetical protein
MDSVSSTPPEEILSSADCEQERSPNDFIEWVEKKYKLLAATQEGRNYARLHKDLAKPFLDEMLPFSHICKHLYSDCDHLTVKPKLGNQNVDAVVTDHTSGQIMKYEFPRAIDGYDESDRLRYFVEHGHVPLTAPITRKGTKASGRRTLDIKLKFVEHDEKVTETLLLEKQSATKKTNKRYGLDTILVILFEDNLFRSVEDRDKLKAFVEKEVLSMRLDFKKLFLLGRSGEPLFKFPLSRPTPHR